MSPPITHTPLPPGAFRAAIAAVLMTILLGALDQTIVSVALPTIAHELGGFGWMAWVISGYLIASTVVTPVYGKLSDLYGRRTMMSIGIGLFLVASVACALAQSLPQLVFARVLQGIGGGGLLAMAQALVADVVPMRERGRYQSYISMVWAVASVAGPVAGGLLTQFVSWPWIFWINLPVGLVAFGLVRHALKHLPVARTRRRVDLAGVLLLVGGLTALLLPISRVGQGVPITEAGNLAGLALACVMLAVFWRHERHTEEPILPVALLKEPVVIACCALLFVRFFLFIALSVLVPLRMQLVLGVAPGEAALRLLPLTLAIPIAAFASGRWMFRTGRVRPLQILGVWLVPVALVALALIAPGETLWSTVAMAVLGVGFGCQMPTALITAQNAIAREWLGTVTALSAFFRLLGGAVGTAVLSALVLAWLRDAPGAAAIGFGPEGLVAGSRPGGGVDDAAFQAVMWVGAAVSLASVVCARHLPDIRLDAAPTASTASDVPDEPAAVPVRTDRGAHR